MADPISKKEKVTAKTEPTVDISANPLTCDKCGAHNATHVKFCGKCGRRLMQTPTSVLRPASGKSQAEDTGPKTPYEPDTPHGFELSVPVAQYKIIEHIGSGGMGAVYLARDEKLDRYVALKRLGPDFAHDAEMKARFFGEAKSIAALTHPNIVHVYAFGDDKDVPFIVMEYVAGPGKSLAQDPPHPPLTLQEKIRRDGVPSPRQAVEMMIKICDAMDYAHRRGVIHRDLKPSNILLDETEQHKIVDFGLARRAQDQDGDIRLTHSGSQIISLGYSAPEQEIDVKMADKRADIYALGGILYFTLTGENPRFFRENTIPAHLRSVLSKALEKDRVARWQTVKEFQQALAAQVVPAKTDTRVSRTGVWRCKWCDTVNTLTSRFCAECGWDGSQICPECSAEGRVGVRYCGNCGADCRAIQEADAMLSRLQLSFNQKDFDQVLGNANAIKDLQPAGKTGRQLLDRATDLTKRSLQAIDRKDSLGEEIAKAQDRDDYQHLSELIDEFETIDASGTYAKLKAGLPQKIVNAAVLLNLSKAKEALKERDWAGADLFCREIVDKLDSNHEEATGILRRLRSRRFVTSLTKLVFMLALFVAIYTLSVCPTFALVHRLGSKAPMKVVRVTHAPVLWLYRTTWTAGPLQRFAALWHIDFKKSDPSRDPEKPQD